MKLGSNDIGSVYIGSTAVNKIYIGSTEVWTSFTGLLDTYSGAAAAYSLRLLSSTYTGDAIQVRRASDNATQDIGFVSGELDTSTLETFCSGTDGFVTTWYDQSGNGYDASQSTAANQPKIVSSGSTILENGKPILKFATSQLPYNSSIISNYNLFTILSVGGYYSVVDKSQCHVAFTTSTFSLLHGHEYKNNFYLGYDGNLAINMGASNLNNNLFTTIADTSNVNAYLNGVNEGNKSTSSRTTNNFNIGLTNNDGYIQEVIAYNSDQSSNRSGIESNINNHYNIY